MPDPRKMQINLTGFLNGKYARMFMGELWAMLDSAQNSEVGGKIFSIIMHKIFTTVPGCLMGKASPLSIAATDMLGSSETSSSSLPSLLFMYLINQLSLPLSVFLMM